MKLYSKALVVLLICQTLAAEDPFKMSLQDLMEQQEQQEERQKIIDAKQKKIDQVRNSIVWILGKIVQKTSKGVLIKTAQDYEIRERTSGAKELGVTELAMQRFKREGMTFPKYLKDNVVLGGGDMWASKMGREYIAQKWIKSVDDYEKFFSLERLFICRSALTPLGKYPPIFTEDLFFVSEHDRFENLVDRDVASIWVIPNGNFSYTTVSGSSKTIRSFVVAPKEITSP